MRTEDLFRQNDFFDAVSTLGSHAGLSFSAAAGVDAIGKLRVGSSGAARGIVLTAVIWGFFWMNDRTKEIIQEEIFRRAGHPA